MRTGFAFIALWMMGLGQGLSLSASLAQAGDLSLAPPAFRTSEGQAVFVDFKRADFEIIYDLSQKTVRVHSKIQFESPGSGHMLFDLRDTPEVVLLDGVPAFAPLIRMPNQSRWDKGDEVRMVSRPMSRGFHELTVVHQIKKYSPTMNDDGVSHGFFMSDFDGRGLLERYLPANLEYDQLQMNITVRLMGTEIPHRVFTNGVKRSFRVDALYSDQTWAFSYPSFYNSSSIYFHIVPVSRINVVEFNLTSIDGRRIPVELYTIRSNLNLERFESVLKETFVSFEKLYGVFPHPAIIVNGTPGGGGMEYAGATITELMALPHELGHSYFGRSVMPANGNAAWIDEAMAMFSGGPGLPRATAARTRNMGNLDPYFRGNEQSGYSYGFNFLGLLDEWFQKGSSEWTLGKSMNAFLKFWHQSHRHSVTTNETLEADLIEFSGMDLKKAFAQYVYGVEPAEFESRVLNAPEHSHIEMPGYEALHLNITVENLKDYQ